MDDRVDAPIRPMNRAPSQEWLGGASAGGLRPGGAPPASRAASQGLFLTDRSMAAGSCLLHASISL